jgi:AcrR family transcriptional regulator
MTRLNRAEMQERNRTRVLAAAQDEFAERGFRDTKIDVIAERAELTRGAVYSNFPGKRALYFAVLAGLAEQAPPVPHVEPGRTTGDALIALARTWLGRLPPSEERWLGMDLLPEVLSDELTRRPYAQLMMLDAVLLGLALERLRPDGRLVRVAETVLTTLHGASQLAAAAPGFGDQFNVARACEQLAYLDMPDEWLDVPFTTQVHTVDEPWAPSPARDSVRGEEVSLAGDGVVAVLGLHRASAIEHAVRAAPPHATVTAVLVSGTPQELIPLARLTVAELTGCLRQAFPEHAWPRLRVVCDQTGALAAAAGVPAVSDTTEVAIRVAGGRVVARAEGYGACEVCARTELGVSERGTRRG